MAEKIMAYTDDLEVIWGVRVNDEVQALMNSLSIGDGPFDNSSVNQKVFLFDTEGDLDAAYSGATMLPADITPRTITLSHPMGQKDVVCPTRFVIAELQTLEAQTAFGDNLVDIVRLRGEINNAPNIEEVP